MTSTEARADACKAHMFQAGKIGTRGATGVNSELRGLYRQARAGSKTALASPPSGPFLELAFWAITKKGPGGPALLCILPQGGTCALGEFIHGPAN